MKKIISMLLAALLILSLAACAKTAETEPTTQAQTAAETTAAVDASAASATIAADEAAAAGTSDAAAINAIFSTLDLTEPEDLGKVTKLGTYTGLEVEAAKPAEIGDDDVENYLNGYVLPAYMEEVDGPIQNGDVANIDYEGKKDGVAFDGGTAQGYDLTIGSGNFIGGFEEGLVGKKKGETVDLDLTFPAEYHAADLAGQAVVFTVKINSIKRQPELTDELAAKIDPENPTAPQLKAAVKKALQQSQDLNARQELYYLLTNQIVAASEIEPDPKAKQYILNTYLKNFELQCRQYYGVDAGTYITTMGGTYEDVLAQYEPAADEAIRQRLVLQEIANKENLEATDDDIAAFAESYGYTKDKLIEEVGEEEAKKLAREEKASQFVVDHATVNYKEAEE